MAKLSYKTKSGANPQGMQKIYFACHPNDFDAYFEPICADIFLTQNCAIFYNSEPETPWDEETMNFELSRMQLIVIPVTLKFLRNPCAELNYAFEKHIPILPLMQDSGIESEYEKVFGDLQYLDKTAILRDPTTLSYDQKLKRYLESILFGDELIEKIRDAFDTYIFMSYRKKDRKQAQDLMRLIHQNKFCRDIAIWYDEYLVPGEHFTEAIKNALKKSELFTLVVTPTLLETNDKGEENYVIKHEYPEAVKSGMPILPVCMQDTDLDDLHNKLDNKPNPGDKLPEPTDGNDATALTQALQDKLPKALLDRFHAIAIDENNTDPVHNYFIGLAYLGGIDAETDYEKAVDLITSAANNKLPEAMRKLADMYKTGEGVERNYETSAKWLDKLVEYWEDKFEKSEAKDDGDELFLALWHAGNAWSNMRRSLYAENMFVKMLIVAERLQARFGGDYHLRNLSISYDELGVICSLEHQKRLYEKSLNIREQLTKNTVTRDTRRDLSIGYERLGDTCNRGLVDNKPSRDSSEARKWYEKSLEIREQLDKEESTPDSLRDLLIAYDRIGNCYLYEHNFSEARKYYGNGLEICEQLVSETGTMQSRRDLSVSYFTFGNVCQSERATKLFEEMRISSENGWSSPEAIKLRSERGELLREAQEWYERSLEIREQLVEETGSAQSRYDLAVNYKKLGDIYKERLGPSGAIEWYENSLNILEQLPEEASSYYDLSSLYYSLRGIYVHRLPKEKFLEWSEKRTERSSQVAQGYGTERVRSRLSSSYVELGDFYKAMGELSEAEEWYRESFKVLDRLGEKNRTKESSRAQSVSYEKMGEICELKGDLSSAIWWYERSVKIVEQLDGELGTTESRHKLSVIYEKIGSIYKGDNTKGSRIVTTLIKAKKWHEESIKWYEKSIRVREQLAVEVGTEESRRELSESYAELGNIYKTFSDLSEAKRYCKKSIEIRKQVVDETGTQESRRCLSASYADMGDICKSNGDLYEAREWLRKSIETRKRLIKESKMVHDSYNLAIGYQMMGQICKDECKLPEARKWQAKSLKIKRQLATQAGTEESRRELSVAYIYMGNICKAENKLCTARRWYKKSLKIREQLVRETGTEKSLQDLAKIYNQMSETFKGAFKNVRSKKWHMRLLQLRKRIAYKTGKASDLRKVSDSYNNIGSIYKSMLRFNKAIEWYMKSLEIDEQLADEEKTIESSHELAKSYSCLGETYFAKFNFIRAKDWFNKSINILEPLARKVKSVEIHDELANTYLMAGIASSCDITYLIEAEAILKTLVEEYPDDPGYTKRLRQVQKLLSRILKPQ